jgi:hypothetical protein
MTTVVGTLSEYATTNGTLTDAYRIDETDVIYGTYLTDLISMVGNIYYKDNTVHTAMSRTESTNTTGCTQSGVGCYTGPLGTYPDLPFMFGNLDSGQVNPYSIGGSTPTPTPTPSPSGSISVDSTYPGYTTSVIDDGVVNATGGTATTGFRSILPHPRRSTPPPSTGRSTQ